ncbi:hypothetical protein N9980_01860 [bacterium]|nr:hypothetical protein [bacterium]
MIREGTVRKLGNFCGSLFSHGVIALFIFGFGIPVIEATENYWVAVDHPNASDSNNGLSMDKPFKTLGRAVQGLRPGITLIIKAGIYREALVLPRDGTADSPIVVRAYPGDEGRVVIRGSDVVKGWTNDGGGVWSVSWQPLPLLDYPASWPNVDGALRSQLGNGARSQFEEFYTADRNYRMLMEIFENAAM